MTNYRITVTRLREVLKSGDLTVITDEHKQIILEYYQHCKNANDRLRDIEGFLQKGLNSEAVHAAQTDPDLLDVVTTLDIPERDILEMVVAAYNNTHEDKIPPAPVLTKSTAEALNHAYESLQSLDDLLKTHRLLALARAPLTERRNVLLNIIQRDPENIVWKEDQVRWEKELVKQLEHFLSLPSVNNDPDDVLSRLKVLEDGQWRIDIPEDLAKSAKNKRHTAERSIGRRDLVQLMEPCKRAFQSRDLATAIKLKADWDQKASEAHLTANDPIYSSLKDFFQWVDGELRTQQHQAKIDAARAKLLKVLQSDASVSSLITAWQQFQEVVPRPDELLVKQYQEVKTRREELGRQRYYLVLVSVVAAVMIVLLGVVFISLHFINEGKIANRKEKLELNKQLYQSTGYLTEEQHRDAEQLIKGIDDEGYGQHPDILRYKEEFRAFIQTQTARQAEFEALIVQCKSLPDKEPDPNLLLTASSKAKSPAEKDRIAKLIQDHANQHAAWKLKMKSEAEQLLQSILTSVKELDTRMDKEDVAAANRLLTKVEGQLKTLGEMEESPDWKIIIKHDRKIWDNLGVLRERSKLVRELGEKKGILDQLTQASTALDPLENSFTQTNSKVSTYISRLNVYLSNFPRTSQARSLKEIARLLDAEVQLERWGDTILRCKGDHLSITVKEAQDCLRLLPDVEALPASEKEKFLALQDFLKHRVQCHFEPKSPAMLFDSNFSLPGVKDAFLVQRKTISNGIEQFYFSEADYQKYSKSFGKDVMQSIQFYRKLESPPVKVEGINLNNFVYPGELSPQTKLAQMWMKEIKPKLGESDQAWRQGLVKMAIAIQEARKLDPIGRVLFLNDCYQALNKTSLIGKKATARQWEYLNDAKTMPDGSDQWLMNPVPGPEGKRLQEHRDNATAILAGFPNLNWNDYVAKEQLTEKAERSRFQSAPVPIGWLNQNADRRWIIHGRLNVWDRQEVFILARTTNAKPVITKLGVIQNGQLITENGVNESSLRKGLPCFVMVKAKEPRSR